MITYFTTAKDFRGKTKTRQINAIRSWKAATPGAEVVVFGACEGIEPLVNQLGISYLPEIKVSDQGTPFINDMFECIARIATHPVCCFVNADIILTSRFVHKALSIHEQLGKNYLAVGQRYDIDLDQELDFSENWQTDLEKLVQSSGSIHPPLGSDYFLFPKGQYLPGEIPDLLVGRGGWDLWMIYHARVCRLHVVDLSPSIKVIHQDHSYEHRKVKFQGYQEDEEALANLQFLPKGETYDYTLLACNFFFEHGKLRRNFARGDLKRYLAFEINLHKKKPFFMMTELFINKCTRSIRFMLRPLFIRTRQLLRVLLKLLRMRMAHKIIIGAGNTSYSGWISTNKEHFDVTNKDHFHRYWKKNSRTAFLAEHVWEHLDYEEAVCAASLCYTYLKPGGRLRIAVPDGYHPDPEYIENVRPGGTGPEDHKILYNYESLSQLLSDVGFRIEQLEYWDEHSNFHRVDWSMEDGHILRSQRYDPRNQDGNLVYTSLIIDAIKPS